jgi:hypothetical protein
MNRNRREILKLSIGAAVAVLVSPFVIGQPSGGEKIAPGNYQLPANKLNDTVTYNAGWIVPLEDRAQLLELESKKSTEQKAAKPAEQTAVVKDKPKTIADRYQEFVGKVKSFF